MKVYLAGTITNDPKHLDWRTWLELKLRAHGHDPISPMRGKDPKQVSANGLGSNISALLFCERDRMDVKRSDVIVSAYFQGLKRQSIGTWMEVGAGVLAWNKPWIVYTDDPLTEDHPFVTKWASSIHNNKEDVLNTILWLGMS